MVLPFKRAGLRRRGFGLKSRAQGTVIEKGSGQVEVLCRSGQLGPFANGYWGHPAYKLPPDVNLLAVAHYLEALEMQAKAASVSALFGGRMPMTMTSPPAGVTDVPSVDDLKNYLFRVKELQDWIDNIFITDLLAIAPFYLGAAGVGKGYANFLSWGVFEDASFDPKKRLLPRGAIFASDFPKVHEAKPEDVTEDTTHGWYKDGKPLNPAKARPSPSTRGMILTRNTPGPRPRVSRASPWKWGPLPGWLWHTPQGSPRSRS